MLVISHWYPLSLLLIGVLKPHLISAFLAFPLGIAEPQTSAKATASLL